MTSANAAVTPPEIDCSHKELANAIRALAMDAVQAANSGHPGMPMGMADVATVLYSKFLKFDPENPTWPDRDRVVLSGGHGSMLLYALNYLTGYEKVTLDDIKNFRQLHRVTAGHPEIEHDAGIETTTGPLGQGIATAVGMALGERSMNARFGDDLVDHYTYVMCGDGDLMEGISHEACSLAGHWGLNKLIVLYDDNGICIDGPTDMSYTENTPERFKAYGWDVVEINGHDPLAIEKAISAAQKSDKPSLICCATHIGYGAPNKQDTAGAHGAPLGEEEIQGTREALDWPHEPFDIPKIILKSWRSIGQHSRQAEDAWNKRLNDAENQEAFLAALEEDVSDTVSTVVKELKLSFAEDKPKVATRKASGMCLDELVPALPQLIGGSADLTGSNLTKAKESGIISKDDFAGQYIHYGVREFGMAAVMNGLAIHGGAIPYGGTFLVFTDYCRPAIRLSALMKQRVIYVMTHDSIGLGEDGPTHQPVEHLSSLRAMPNVNVFRPCDGIETAESWEIALNSTDTPSVLALSRQGLPTLRKADEENLSAKGIYILRENADEPEITLFASGSEVEIALEAYETLVAHGHKVRLASAPCLDLFWEQDGEHIQKLICNKSIKIAVEAGCRQGWERIIGPHAPFIGMDSFGASAPANVLYDHFGITAKEIVEAAKKKLALKNQ